MTAVRVPVARHRDVVQQRLVALDGPGDAVHVEAAGAGGRLGLGAPGQRAAGEHQVDIADRDGVAVVQQRRLDARAVDERAVDAAVVADLGAAGRGHQRGVVARGQHVGDDDVVVGGATDLDRARRHLGGPARPQDLQHARREVALARARRGRRAQRGDRFESRAEIGCERGAAGRCCGVLRRMRRRDRRLAADRTGIAAAGPDGYIGCWSRRARRRRSVARRSAAAGWARTCWAGRRPAPTRSAAACPRSPGGGRPRRSAAGRRGCRC